MGSVTMKRKGDNMDINANVHKKEFKSLNTKVTFNS